MSATNRGTERNPQDYYATPLHTVREFTEAFSKLEPAFKFEHTSFLDPCAGGDTDNEMSYPTVLKELGATNITTIDVRPDSKADIIGDYLTLSLPEQYDASFTNPPFNEAIPFILKAMQDVKEGGFVAMLLRINFYGSQRRKSFWDRNMPKYTIIHSKRPKFTKEGSDATEYAHFVWQKGYHGLYSKVVVV